MKHIMTMHGRMMDGGLHTPSPRKKRVTGYKHIAPTPKKTGVFSSGGGTGTSTGVMKQVGRKPKRMAMTRPDKHGFYPHHSSNPMY